jgi:hypothetical protein
MRIKELVEKYEKNNRIDIAKEIEAVPYIGIIQKKQLAELVLEGCVYEVNGQVRIDSVDRYILFAIAVISVHTNLEFDYEDNMAISDYDLLCESGLLIKVIDTFKDDYASCQEILNMMTSDKLQESLTLEQTVYKFLDEIAESLDSTLNKVAEQLNLDSLKDLNLKQTDLLKFLNSFNQQ